MLTLIFTVHSFTDIIFNRRLRYQIDILTQAWTSKRNENVSITKLLGQAVRDTD